MTLPFACANVPQCDIPYPNRQNLKLIKAFRSPCDNPYPAVRRSSNFNTKFKNIMAKLKRKKKKKVKIKKL